MHVAKNILSIGAALIAGSALLSLSTAAFAWDRDHDRWEHERHERWEQRHHWDHERYVERPVYIAPRPVYVTPPPVVYAPSAPQGLNLNFNIPLN